jgi:hypothetical protein
MLVGLKAFLNFGSSRNNNFNITGRGINPLGPINIFLGATNGLILGVLNGMVSTVLQGTNPSENLSLMVGVIGGVASGLALTDNIQSSGNGICLLMGFVADIGLQTMHYVANKNSSIFRMY